MFAVWGVLPCALSMFFRAGVTEIWRSLEGCISSLCSPSHVGVILAYSVKEKDIIVSSRWKGLRVADISVARVHTRVV